MTRRRLVLVGVAALAAPLGCDRKADGLPPSTEPGGAGRAASSGEPSTLPPGHPAPHGTIGTDVSKMGLPAPDPSRPLDPAHHVRGVLHVAPALAAKLHDGGAVFVVVKRDDHGAPSGPPLAVQRLSWKPDLAFELTERQAMIGGTELIGDVIVTARYDHDGDALTKQPGDLTGVARAKIPADALALTLDTVLP